MMDYFSLLNQPRQPWLDPEALKHTFHTLSATVHPDRVHGAGETERSAAQAHYVQLNAAYQCLREPKDRLVHLLELETGSKPVNIQSIPPDTLELFTEVGKICREVDRFLEQRAQVTSPLMKVELFSAEQELADKISALQQNLAARRTALERELQSLNPSWQKAPAPGSPDRAGCLPLARLAQIHQLLSYLNRWQAQLQERTVQLAVGMG